MKKRVISVLLITSVLTAMLVSCSKKEALIGEDAEETSGNVTVVDIALTEEAYGIGVDKDQPELLASINDFIEKGFENGKYEEITGHFFEKDGKPEPVYSVELDNGKDQLVVATTGDFEPFDYYDGDVSYGIDKELIKAIADELGKDLVLVNVNFDFLFETVQQKKCDVCIAGITIRDDRKEYVDFSVPYFHTGQCIAVRKDNNEFAAAKKKEDVEKILSELDPDKTIAVEADTTGEDYLRGQDEGGFKGVKCNIKECSTLSECILELNNGTVDYVLGDLASLKYLLAND